MTHPSPPRIAIIGTVGLPARYGGFETLADALVRAAEDRGVSQQITVYCSAPQSGDAHPSHYRGAQLTYLPVKANGAQSVIYDIWSMIHAARSGQSTALILGVSGCLFLPVMRIFTKMRLIVHVDGIEWQRPKWRGLARFILRHSERLAARYAHSVISDNAAITAHLADTYGRDSVEITYGSDTALSAPATPVDDLGLPERYALAIARVEPENNLDMILGAFKDLPQHPLVVVGNWTASDYGRSLKAKYDRFDHLHLLPAEYDAGRLRMLREGATLFLHGHSAGGTNPSLVDMMQFAIPIAAYDCVFNRETTGNLAGFFDSAATLRNLVPDLTAIEHAAPMGRALRDHAQKNYRWSDVTAAYFQLLGL